MRLTLVLLAGTCLFAADAPFLRRQLSEVAPCPADLTLNAKGASYKPLFGEGDADASALRSVARYGELSLEPGAASALVSYPAEEQIYFIGEGSGTVIYGDRKAPVRKDDFVYLPVGMKHGIANTSNSTLRVIVIGHRIPARVEVRPTPELMLANAGDVALQILGQHGPTTQFKLLMGLTNSTRDKLAAAYVMNSLFLMDFAPGGTNIPHNHPAEEEVYLLLRGTGDMVAGGARLPVREGAAFFFAPGTQVGYYSNAKEGQAHDLILAVRSRR